MPPHWPAVRIAHAPTHTRTAHAHTHTHTHTAITSLYIGPHASCALSPATLDDLAPPEFYNEAVAAVAAAVSANTVTISNLFATSTSAVYAGSSVRSGCRSFSAKVAPISPHMPIRHTHALYSTTKHNHQQPFRSCPECVSRQNRINN